MVSVVAKIFAIVMLLEVMIAGTFGGNFDVLLEVSPVSVWIDYYPRAFNDDFCNSVQ